MSGLHGFLKDLFTIFKLLLLNVYFYAEIILKNFIIPKKCFYKNLNGKVVLITGAGLR